MSRHSLSTTVLGGFPVEVEFTALGAEPDVGIFGPQIEDICLYTLRGKHAAWLEKKMTDEDWRNLEYACAKYVDETDGDYYEDY